MKYIVLVSHGMFVPGLHDALGMLASSMGVNLVGATIIASMFAIINYKIKMLQIAKPVAGAAGTFDDDEEDI